MHHTAPEKSTLSSLTHPNASEERNQEMESNPAASVEAVDPGSALSAASDVVLAGPNGAEGVMEDADILDVLAVDAENPRESTLEHLPEATE